MTGLRLRWNIVDENLAIRPRRRSSATSVVPCGITHIRCTRRPSGLRTRRAAERRWIRIPAARRRAYSGETSNPMHPPNKGSPLKEGENREREINIIYLYFSEIFFV